MTITLNIKPAVEYTKNLYSNHTSYHEGDSGLDLFIPKQIMVPGGATGYKIDLEIACSMHESEQSKDISYYMYPRSSISKTPLRLSNSVGIIDAGYRGNLQIAVDNLSDTYYTVESGTRLVQICTPGLVPFNFKLVDALSETTRGSGGFGSTGL